MASAQVLSKPMKSKEHLEAGRRRLEEFRKKKGAKKSAAPSQPSASISTPAEKQASEHGPSPVDSAGPADRMTAAVSAASEIPVYTGKEHGFAYDSESQIGPQSQIVFQGGNYSSPDLLPVLQKRVESEASVGDENHDVAISRGSHSGLQDDVQCDFRSDFYGESLQPNNEFRTSSLELGHKQYGLAFKNHLSSKIDERSPSDALGSSLEFGSRHASESLSGGLNSNASGPIGGILSSTVAETFPRRSRPSFLDSLNISRESPAYELYVQFLTEKENFLTSELPNLEVSSRVQDSSNSVPVEPFSTTVYSSTKTEYFGNGFMGQNMLENNTENKLEFHLQRQNEDFSALEQHIEDLTHEKFSLQCEMEASKALAESLASENSSLTESYNQQASIVSQLKAEMERLQEEIKARLVELEAIKAEFTNAHLECNAADERAKLLASEVINLEEKALRLRSNELKLERELENSNAEIASYKKKLASLEKICHDLKQTVDALQEEKKLLQSKSRTASTSGNSIDPNRGHTKKDASTSTSDLGNNSVLASSNIQMGNDTENLSSLLKNTFSGVEDVAMIIPPDQVQVIQNINLLISEIITEKEEVVQALINEVTTSAKLKGMNKDLSHKLEVQTQRLELLTAQSMANENPPVRQPVDSPSVQETVAYADEGDEVVERVLGWILKLFPGGPSKRMTNRL